MRCSLVKDSGHCQPAWFYRDIEKLLKGSRGQLRRQSPLFFSP
jgi:hypothetical protein